MSDERDARDAATTPKPPRTPEKTLVHRLAQPKSADELVALVPKTILLTEHAEGASAMARAEVLDHFSVMFWIANDCCWSQETRWVYVPMAFVVIFFTHNVWASRNDANEFRHALAVFFWLVGANSCWVWMDFYGSVYALEVWCVICFATSVLIEAAQLTVLAVPAMNNAGEVDTQDVTDAFQAIAILSWAAHDLTVFLYYNLSSVSQDYCRVAWWILGAVIVFQVSYYLYLQIKIYRARPESSGVDYALALFAWSIGCIFWEFGDFYATDHQDPEPVFRPPRHVDNFRWWSFWIIVIGALPLAVWCVRHSLNILAWSKKNR